MKPFFRLVRLVPLVLLLASCGTSVVAGSHMPTPVDVSNRPTFAWVPNPDAIHGDPRLEGNQFFEDRLQEAVAWHLSLRGIRPTVSAPTFTVHHHLTLSEHAYFEEVMDDAGVTRVDTYPYERGSVTVHMMDAATGGTVWVGWAQANIEPALTSPDAMQRWVYDVVGAMFEKWPIPGRDGS